MKDRNFEFPCLLDLTLVCPQQCKLRKHSVRLLLSLANQYNRTPEEELVILRSGTKEELNLFRAINADSLRKAGKITKCAHYPQSVVNLASTQLDEND